MNKQTDEEMKKWQAEELEARSNKRERNPCSKPSFHLFRWLRAPTCTMYLCKVLKTHRHAQTTKEKGAEEKSTRSSLWDGIFPNTTLKVPPVFLTFKAMPNSTHANKNFTFYCIQYFVLGPCGFFSKKILIIHLLD